MAAIYALQEEFGIEMHVFMKMRLILLFVLIVHQIVT